jgi:hypothetical protein
LTSDSHINVRRSAASGELDLHMARIGPPLVGCSGLILIQASPCSY